MVCLPTHQPVASHTSIIKSVVPICSHIQGDCCITTHMHVIPMNVHLLHQKCFHLSFTTSLQKKDVHNKMPLDCNGFHINMIIGNYEAPLAITDVLCRLM